MEHLLLGNIRRIYAMGIFRAFELIIPVFVPLLLGKGLSMSEILQTQAIFALTVALFEVPSGYLADVYGRKLSLLLSALLTVLGYVCLLEAGQFHEFLIFEIIMGVSVSLSSGADMAMLFDSQRALQALNRRFQLPVTVSRLVALSSLAECGAALLVSVVFLTVAAETAYTIVLGAQLLLAVPPLMLAFSLVEPPRTVSTTGLKHNAGQITALLFGGNRMVLWISIVTVAFSLIGLCAFWTFQRFWDAQSVPLEYFGFLWAAHCATRALAAHAANQCEEWLGTRLMMILMAALPAVAFLGMAGLPGWAGVACALLFPVCRGMTTVTLFDGLNRRLDGEFRATVNSILSLAVRALFIIAGPLLGLAVDVYGVHRSLLGLAVLSLPLFILATMGLLRALKQQHSALTAGPRAAS